MVGENLLLSEISSESSSKGAGLLVLNLSFLNYIIRIYLSIFMRIIFTLIRALFSRSYQMSTNQSRKKTATTA